MNPEIARRPVAQRLREWLIARCLAPINLDGSQVSEVTIDGDSVSEVTMDGDQVFGAIPDGSDLHSHWDVSDLSSIDPLPNQTDETDLTVVGGPTLVTGEKNGLNVARYDGNDDGHVGTYNSAITQPSHSFVVYRYRNSPWTDGDSTYIFGSDDSNNRHDVAAKSTDGGATTYWSANAGSNITGGVLDTNWHIATVHFDGGNSYMRLDGSQIASGDPGAGNFNSVGLGWLPWNGGNYAPVDVGEMLVYPQDKSTVESDVEQYLNDKWAVF